MTEKLEHTCGVNHRSEMPPGCLACDCDAMWGLLSFGSDRYKAFARIASRLAEATRAIAKLELEKAAVWQGHAELFARCTQLTLDLAKARGWSGDSTDSTRAPAVENRAATEAQHHGWALDLVAEKLRAHLPLVEMEAVELAHLERGAELLMELYGAQLHLTKGRQIERAKSDDAWIEAEVARQEKKEPTRDE